jgi:hypothetical protein
VARRSEGSRGVPRRAPGAHASSKAPANIGVDRRGKQFSRRSTR